MTENNNRRREILKSAEGIINTALHSQPEDDAKCEEHLAKAIKDVYAIVARELSSPQSSYVKQKKVAPLSAHIEPSFKLINAGNLYSFRGIRYSKKNIIVREKPDGTTLFANRFHEAIVDIRGSLPSSDEQTETESIEAKAGRSSFITKEEFEKNVLGPFLGIPGEIFSVIPFAERFKITAHYEPEWIDRDGFRNGGETKLAHVDLLTSGGMYNAGCVVATLIQEVHKARVAKALEEQMFALQNFNFFYKSLKETFVLMDDVPSGWKNFNHGNLLKGQEEHTLDYWRAELLKKYGFENVDFSKADKGREE